MIPQLITGTLGEVTISSDDVPLGSFSGDFVVTAHDIPIRGGDIGSASAKVTLDEAQLRSLMSTVDGFPADTLGLDAPNVTMSTELSLFGVGFPVGVALTPSAVDGDLVLSPDSLQLAGASITAADLRKRFGKLSDVVLKDWTVCVAQYIPAGATLTDVAVEGETLVAGFTSTARSPRTPPFSRTARAPEGSDFSSRSREDVHGNAADASHSDDIRSAARPPGRPAVPHGDQQLRILEHPAPGSRVGGGTGPGIRQCQRRCGGSAEPLELAARGVAASARTPVRGSRRAARRPLRERHGRRSGPPRRRGS